MRRDDGWVVKLEAVNRLYLLQTLSTPKWGSALVLLGGGDTAGKGEAK